MPEFFEKERLHDEDLKEVTGGVNTLGGYTVGDSHLLHYPNNSGHERFTIESINENSSTPFYVLVEFLRANYTVNGTSHSNFTLSDMNYYWGKTTIG